MESLDYTNKYCVVGAGSSGLAAAKNLQQQRIPFDVVEGEDDVGGIWYYGRPRSTVYRSAHLISSKPLTQYTDFPMPKDFPDFPNHAQVWKYLRSYARAFNLYDHIEFKTTVERIEPAGDFWDVGLDAGQTRRYRGVIIANGHNWDPRYPDYPGAFSGIIEHSAQYKTPDIFRGKRVLVVGGGNSGCDIAVEAVPHAERVYHSMRRGYYYVPKYIFGKPSDQFGEILLKLRLPLRIRRSLTALTIRKIAIGNPRRFGLPAPDHKLYETHPIINSQILYHLAHGDIIPKPDVRELRGDRVLFKDGTTEPLDVIIYATGFRIVFPFIDPQYLNWKQNRPGLYLHVFHPDKDNLFVAGLIQPDSGQWGLVDLQTQLIAKFIWALDHDPRKAMKFRRLKGGPQPDLGHGIKYLSTPRHSIEVEHYSYRRLLRSLIAGMT